MKRGSPTGKVLLSVLFPLLLSIPCRGQEGVNTGIIPTPQEVILHKGSCPLGPLSFDNDSSLLLNPDKGSKLSWQRGKKPDQFPGDQHYRLEISPKGVAVYARTFEGATYALRSLQQLQWRYGDTIPCMTIIDGPAFTCRGWLDDISRGPIINGTCKLKVERLMQLAKMNFASYYTEHALYNPQYPDLVPPVWSRESVLPAMVNLQCLAHFEKTLRIPFYNDIMDTRYNVNPAQEATYRFLRSQIANAWSLASSRALPLFNINCDETEGLGGGKAGQYVRAKGADNVYCEHINKVYHIVLEEYRKLCPDGVPEVLMWGDIVAKNPDMLALLPPQMNYVVWSYVAQDSYDAMLAPFRKAREEHGNPFWVAPGVSHWSSTPQVENYMKNIAFLARDGYLAGARGLMNTAWDDSGESLMGDCLHAMLWAAEMAWHPLKNKDRAEAERELAERARSFNENYNRLLSHFYGKDVDAAGMIMAVDNLSRQKCIGDWYNTGALYQPLLDFYPAHVGDGMIARCDSADALLAAVECKVDSSVLPHWTYACHRMALVSEKSRLRALLYRALESGSVSDCQEAQRLASRYFHDIHALKREYLRLWDQESTPYSRDLICERYDALGREVEEAFYHVFIDMDTSRDGLFVRLRSISNTPVFYTLDGRKPTEGSALYHMPFVLRESRTVKAMSMDQWGNRYESEQYLLCHKGMGHLAKLNTEYSTYQPWYSGGGASALADGVMGSDLRYSDGHWQGYWGKDIDVSFDFQEPTSVSNVTMRFLQNTFDWVLAPTTIEVYSSADGNHWRLERRQDFDPDWSQGGNIVRTDAIRDLKLSTRYLRVVAKNPGPLPSWHPAAGNDSYLFADEIVIE